MGQLICFLIGSIGAWVVVPAGTANAQDRPSPRVPPGFVVERAAPGDSVRFPMFAALDDRGRLFVAESSGLDLYVEISAGTRKCRVSVLEDQDGDGQYEFSRVFADGLVFPMGLAWRNGRLYIADPPDLVTLEDTDGDGRADRRTVILTGFGHIDNGSLHGLTFGPDGLLSMTMGTPDGYRLATADGAHLEGKSGAWIRCRPDGSSPEVVSRGFVNLVEIAFLPGGDAVGTDNWFQEPAGGFRDALVHLVAGGRYPYIPDEGTPQPITGEPLPPIARFPAVALSGLARYRGRVFPEEYWGNLFSAQHNTRSIGRHVLVPDGSTFRSEDSDFLTSEDPDFHPSDILEDADGSLLVIDTGAWYVQHCPTGRIRETPARGGIYRVRKSGSPPLDDPLGLELNWSRLSVDRLATLLSDRRPAVRDRAGRELTGRGGNAIAALAGLLQTSSGKLEAIWGLAAIPDSAALAPLRQALADADEEAACAAARALSHRTDRGAEMDLIRLVTTGGPRARLAAAEALARCGGPEALPALWQGLTASPDRFLKHALIHAAHRLASTEALQSALARPEPAVQAAAMLLLDQPPRPTGLLASGVVVARLDSPDAGLREAARHVLMRHPEWSEDAIDHIRGRIRAVDRSEEAALAELVLAFQDRNDVQTLLAGAATGSEFAPERRAWALETIALSRLSPLPDAWVDALARSVGAVESSVRHAAVRAAAVFQDVRLDAPLLAFANAPAERPNLRLEALRAVMPRQPELSPIAFDLVIGRLGASEDPLSVLSAGELIGRARLSDAQRLQVLRAVGGQALITPTLLRGAFSAPVGDEAVAAWVDYVEQSLRDGWRPSDADLETLVGALPNLPVARRTELRNLHVEASRDRRALIVEHEPLLADGDPARGRAVFFGKAVACSACHRVADEGGRIGPDLTRIGAIRSGRDLLESILWPSSTFAQGYESYSIATSDGRVLTGVIVRQDASVVLLRDSSGGETQLRRDELAEVRRSETSMMPEGLSRVLTREEFRDLLAFLRSQN